MEAHSLQSLKNMYPIILIYRLLIMTLLKVDLRVASTESFGDFKGFPVLNGIFKTLIDHTANRTLCGISTIVIIS